MNLPSTWYQINIEHPMGNSSRLQGMGSSNKYLHKSFPRLLRKKKNRIKEINFKVFYQPQDSCYSRSDNATVTPMQAVNCYEKTRPHLISHEEGPCGGKEITFLSIA